MTTGEVIALIKAFGGGGGPSGGGVMVVHDVDGTLDKTWKEINDAGFAVLKRTSGGGAVSTEFLYLSMINGEAYIHVFCGYLGNSRWTENGYVATSESGYPVYTTP